MLLAIYVFVLPIFKLSIQSNGPHHPHLTQRFLFPQKLLASSTPSSKTELFLCFPEDNLQPKKALPPPQRTVKFKVWVNILHLVHQHLCLQNYTPFLRLQFWWNTETKQIDWEQDDHHPSTDDRVLVLAMDGCSGRQIQDNKRICQTQCCLSYVLLFRVDVGVADGWDGFVADEASTNDMARFCSFCTACCWWATGKTINCFCKLSSRVATNEVPPDRWSLPIPFSWRSFRRAISQDHRMELLDLHSVNGQKQCFIFK